MSWFDCKITYEKEVNQSGKMRKVSESYLVDAETFTDAEARMAEEMGSRGSYIMDSVRKIRLYELFLDEKSERYYKSKVGFITLDEKAGVEKRKYVQMIVQADDIDEALQNIHKGMKDTLGDYEVVSITETAYMDVFKYQIKTGEE
ncbi:MAG: DUF4494 domain-containing protein [Porphyromonas sp.]|nr:DUF4494 domain-containing protein [Porphyromonas sp.]